MIHAYDIKRFSGFVWQFAVFKMFQCINKMSRDNRRNCIEADVLMGYQQMRRGLIILKG